MSNDFKYGRSGTILLLLLIAIAICMWPAEQYRRWRSSSKGN